MDKQNQDRSLQMAAGARIRDALREVCDLERLAREASAISTPDERHRALGWCSHRAVDLDTLARVHGLAHEVTVQAPADLVLYIDGEGGQVYLRRWWLTRRLRPDGKAEGGLYVHVFEGDDPASLHNHPWPSASLMVSGGVVEHSHQGRQEIGPGTLCIRPARFRHRLVLNRDDRGTRIRALSVIATGERCQRWGFEDGRGDIVYADESDDLMRRAMPQAQS